MSELEKLVCDIGYQVGLLTSQLEEEKTFLSELQSKFRSLSKETQSKREVKRALEEEIKQLENTYFRQSKNCDELENTTDALKQHNQYLETALIEIKKSNEKLRQERMDFVSECRKKLKVYEDYFNENEKLKMFIDLWKSKRTTNGELISKCHFNFMVTAPGLPDVIKETARKMVAYYENPLEPTLVMAAELEEKLSEEVHLANGIDTDPGCNHRERKTAVLRGINGFLANESDLIMDSQLVDSSRLRVSALDTSIIPQKDDRDNDSARDDSTMVLNITDPSGDMNS
ncbi:hypothetical protein D915_005298 [Fasciola hepatica]|uniref:Uncharacterized protein n=1 Tax=Fasciola hepatica TaxID=6192 RepID=A0A4E0R730_FASHE|nr:hypothetical protein D915_005298 [Fasciola hepatica]